MSAAPKSDRVHALRDLLRREALSARLAARLREAGVTAPLRDATVDRCWSAKRGGFRFQFSLRFRSGEQAVVFASPQPRRSHRAREALLANGRLTGLRVVDRETGLLLHSVDCDPDLPTLRACLSGRRMAGRLREILGLSGRNGAPAGIELLGCKPNRRAALAVRVPTGHGAVRMMVKVHHREDPAGRARRSEAVRAQLIEASGGRVRTPRVLGHDADLGLIAYEWADGHVPGRNDGRGLDAAIDTLACLHRLDAPLESRFTVGDELAVVKRWVESLGSLRPRMAPRALRLLDVLRARAAALAPCSPCVIHRDFYEKQLILASDHVTVVDLDTLTHGDAAQDLGNYLAHLALAHARAEGGAFDWRTLLRRIVRRYNRVTAPVDRERVVFYAAASLIRGGSLHALRTHTRRCSAGLWRTAAAMLRCSLTTTSVTVVAAG